MKKINIFLLFLLLLHLLLLIGLQFTAWPEMTLWPYLVIKGLLPYKDIAIAHNPLLIFILAGYYKIFGLSLVNLKLFAWGLILITDCLIWFISLKLTKSYLFSFLSLIFYILWQPYFEGNGLWFDLALTPLALLIFYLLWRQKFFWAGLVLGISILVKQTAVWFLVPVIWEIWVVSPPSLKLWRVKEMGKNICLLAFGVVTPLIGLIVYLLFTGTLGDFYFWTIKFGIFYLPHASGQVELPTLKQLISLSIPFASILFILIAFILRVIKIKNQNNRLILILLIWSITASLGVLPRWSNFHFQPALPFLAIISGLCVYYNRLAENLAINGGDESKRLKLVKGPPDEKLISRSFPQDSFKLAKITLGFQPREAYINILYKRHRIMILILLFFVTIGTIYMQTRFYRLNWHKADRFFEKETLETAAWLKRNTQPNERIFILNSWDHLYALSDTLPVTDPWMPTLPWYLEYPGIQDKIVADLKQNKPNLLVFEPYKESGLGSYRPAEIDKLIKENYKLKEMIGNRFWVLELL